MGSANQVAANSVISYPVRFIMIWYVLLTAFFILLPAQHGYGQTSSHSGVDQLRDTGPSVQQVSKAVERLEDWYDPQTGLWRNTGWWNSANALTVLIDYMRVSGDRSDEPVIAETYAQKKHAGFLNEYYDDEGWWALAWIDAYDLTGDSAYLGVARAIFKDMTTGWDDVCGGGIWWRKRRDYKNAIANELFLDVAARLASRVPASAARSAYTAWAEREWNWFRQSGMIEPDHLISDGLTAQCKDNHGTKWTYNQGVILGGLVALSQVSESSAARSDLRYARKIANSAIERLTDKEGILHEPCEPDCGSDGSQFKGIFVRNLALLNQRRPEKRFRQFILTNARSILARDQHPDHSFGLIWSGPPGSATVPTQSSALDALVAALGLLGSQRQ